MNETNATVPRNSMPRASGCSLSLQESAQAECAVEAWNTRQPRLKQVRHVAIILFVGGDEQRGEWIAPVELTASAARVSKFLPQLRAGAEIASNLLPRDVQVRFRPIAAYGGELRRSERDNFLKKANHVVFRNKPTPVKLVRCGSPLTKALSG